MRFAHISDQHLGYMQYGLPERFNDFGDAWVNACKKVAGCDFVILGGDLFHHRQIGPEVLSQAEAGLKLLTCPVYAIEGNHELPRSDSELSWLHYLELEGYLTILNCITKTPVKEGDFWLYGLPWLGAATNSIIDSIDFRPNSILVAHAGYELMPSKHPGTILYETIRNKGLHMILLGHIHKPYQDGLVFNPGSLENVSAEEAAYDTGFFIFDDSGGELVPVQKRPYKRFSIPGDAVESSAGCILDITRTEDVPLPEFDPPLFLIVRDKFERELLPVGLEADVEYPHKALIETLLSISDKPKKVIEVLLNEVTQHRTD